MSKQDPPFKLPLKPTPYIGGIMDSDGEWVACTDACVVELEDARRDWIIMCVNAHADLVAIAKRFRTACVELKLYVEDDGSIADCHTDDIREIDDALAETAAEDQP